MGRLSREFPTAQAVDAALKRANKAEVDVIDLNSKVSRKVDHSEYATETQNLQEQINNIVAEASESGDVSYEVVQARVDNNGDNHDTLKERLDVANTLITIDNEHISYGEIPIQLVGWTLGSIDGTTGEAASTVNPKFARTTEYLELDTDTVYRCYPYVKYGVPNTIEISAYFYDASYNYISTTSVTGATFKADGKYARFVCYYKNTPVNLDIRDARMIRVVVANTQNKKNKEFKNTIDTVFNTGLCRDQFKWEHGLINMTTGADNASKSRVYARTIGFYSAIDAEYVEFDYSAHNTPLQVAKLTIYYYDDNKNFVKASAVEHSRMQIVYPFYRLVYYYQGTSSDVNIEDAKNTEIVYKSNIKDTNCEDLVNFLFDSGEYKFDDIIWEHGSINATSGQDTTTVQLRYARTIGYLKTPTIADGAYFTVPAPVVNTTQTPALSIYRYDENKNYIDTKGADNRKLVVDAPYFRLVYYYKNTPVDVDLTDAELTYYTCSPDMKVSSEEVLQSRANIKGTVLSSLSERLESDYDFLHSATCYLQKGQNALDCGTWTHGSIDTTTGRDGATNLNFARTREYIPLQDGKIYNCYPPSQDVEITAYFYNDDHDFISAMAIKNATFKADGRYMRLVCYYSGAAVNIEIKLAETTIITEDNNVDLSLNQAERDSNTIFDTGIKKDSFAWEHGLIDMSTGVDRSNRDKKYARTIGYYSAKDAEYVEIDYSVVKNTTQTAKLTIYYYDDDKTFVKAEAVEHERIQIIYPYYRLVYYYFQTPTFVEIEDAQTTVLTYKSEIKNWEQERLVKCLFEDGLFTFNDIVWKSGLINMTTGEDNPTINYKFAKTVGYLKTPALGKAIHFTVPPAVVNASEIPALTIYYYDENKNFVSQQAADNRDLIISHPYFRLVYYYKNTPVNADLTDAGLTYYTYTPSIKVPISLETALTRNKYIAFGDSITWGHLSGDGTGSGRATDPYPSVVGRSLGLDVTYGARTGSGWVHPSGTTTAVTIVDSTDCSGYNLATLAFGTNDWYGNIPMGTLSDTGTTTIIGAMKHCVEKILSDNPSICLIIITPINAKNLNAIDGAKTNQGNYRYNTPNTQGITLEEICAAEVQVAEYYGIPCIDNSKGSIVNRQNTANGSIFIDTLHPTNDFYKTLGQYYSGRIGEYFRGYVSE